MNLEQIRENYLGKKLELYLIDGEEVALEGDTLSVTFKAEIFDDEALDIANSLCKASLTLNGERRVVDIAPLECQKELEVLEDYFVFLDCPATGEHYEALHYALMCAVVRE